MPIQPRVEASQLSPPTSLRQFATNPLAPSSKSRNQTPKRSQERTQAARAAQRLCAAQPAWVPAEVAPPAWAPPEVARSRLPGHSTEAFVSNTKFCAAHAHRSQDHRQTCCSRLISVHKTNHNGPVNREANSTQQTCHPSEHIPLGHFFEQVAIVSHACSCSTPFHRWSCVRAHGWVNAG
jgi:hypothetical protein